MVRSLIQTGFHHWPVVDSEQQLVGIVSDTDIVRAIDERCAILAGSANDASCIEDCRVEEIMSRNLVTIDQNESPKRALRTLIDHRIHSLPVIQGGRVTAILTSTDFLREFSYGQLEVSREPVAACVGEVTNQLDVEATLDEALAMFEQEECNYICVCEGGLPLGIVSQRDVRSARCRDLAREFFGDEFTIEKTSLARLVSSAPTCMPGELMYDAASKLVESGLRAIAAVTRSHRLIGMITDEDILRAVLYDGL